MNKIKKIKITNITIKCHRFPKKNKNKKQGRNRANNIIFKQL